MLAAQSGSDFAVREILNNMISGDVSNTNNKISDAIEAIDSVSVDNHARNIYKLFFVYLLTNIFASKYFLLFISAWIQCPTICCWEWAFGCT
jgi:hypothetical protein